MLCFNFNLRVLRRRKFKRAHALQEAERKARHLESILNRISHYSNLMTEVVAQYEAIRAAIEGGDRLPPNISVSFNDIAMSGMLITNKLLSILGEPEKLVTPEAEAKINQLIRFHEYAKKALALTFVLKMNSMPLAVAHKESPAIAKGNTSAEFSYISHVLCAQICEMEALVKRVKLSDPTVKKHDLKMARLLPLKTIYAMLPRIEEIAPTMPEEDQSIVRGLERDIHHFVAVLTTFGDMSDEERLAKVWGPNELTVEGTGGDIWAEIPVPY